MRYFCLMLVFAFGSACAPSAEVEDVSENAVHESAYVPDFDGNAHVPAAYDGEYVSTVIMVALERSIVESMLPAEVELAEQELTGEGKHPFFVLHNRFSRLSAPGLPDVAYDEYAAYVPAVRLRDGFQCGQGPLVVNLGTTAFMPILFLNHPQPIQIGVDYYGFNKFAAGVAADDWSFEVSDATSGARIYRAEFGAEEPLTRSGRWRIARVQNAWPNTLLGKMRTDGTMIWSGFHPDFANADYTSVDARVELELPALGRIVVERGGINDTYLGTWRVRTRATGSIPVPCATAM
jgi:hypothetical protein